MIGARKLRRFQEEFAENKTGARVQSIIFFNSAEVRFQDRKTMPDTMIDAKPMDGSIRAGPI